MIVKHVDRRRIKRSLRKGLCIAIAGKGHEAIKYGWDTTPTKYGTFLMKSVLYINPNIKNLVQSISIRKCRYIEMLGGEPDNIRIIDEPSMTEYRRTFVLVHFNNKNDMAKFNLLMG